MELEKHKDENILLIGDLNSRNNIWDRNANNNSRMSLIPEDMILWPLHHNNDFTYQQSKVQNKKMLIGRNENSFFKHL